MDSILQAGVTSAPLQVILDRLTTLAANEISYILGVDDEVRKLKRTLERIKAMVGQVEENRSLFSNEAWKVCLEDVEKIAYAADDLLDGLSLDLSKCGAHLSTDVNGNNKVRNMLLSSLKLTTPRDISSVMQELENISKEMDALFINESIKWGSSKIVKFRSDYDSTHYRVTSSLVNEEFVIGRDRDIIEIVCTLLNEDLRRSNLCVIPIVGMGGIGKTTLAQVVYRDESVMKKFDLRIWVSVSVNFDTVKITKSIIESATGKGCKLSDLDPVQVKLQDVLRHRRFLLVLDDYWSEEYEDWDVLSSPFRVGKKGSKIIVTTRSKTVSRILGTVAPYDLQGLTDRECWKVMKQKAFSSLNLERNLHLKDIGRMIARKCKGVPLAAKTLGSMLRSNYDPKKWNSVLTNEIWDFPQDNNDIIPALTLSFHYLPAHLKKCFAYCSIFQKNYEFEIEELVLLWMAEGFIHPVGKERIEDLGGDYFKSLLWRSFFQPSHVDANGKEIYKMHDLIHNVAQLVSSHTFCLENNVSDKEIINARYLSVHYQSFDPVILKGFTWNKNLRTLRVSCENSSLQVPYELFLKFQSLRALDLSRLGLDELPDSIDGLRLIRYLNLSENHFTKLPESITNLFGLLVLKLEQCFQLLELPRNMRNLVNLRHLDVDINQFSSMPSQVGRLVNLQSLCAFIITIKEGCGIGELKNMRFLKGSICIKNLENVTNITEAREAMLGEKPYLDKIELEWGDPESGVNHEEILAGLHPHNNLKELSIKSFSGFLFPNWLGDPLCMIQRIHLYSCLHSSILSSLGNLQHLEALHIEDMADLEILSNHNFCGFRSLTSLTMKDLPNWTEWTRSVDTSTSLRTLSIIDCPKLTNLPSLLHICTLQNLHISRCPNVQSFPDDGLPNSLQELRISESDIIASRCRMDEGEDWQKVMLVPKIVINSVEICRVTRGDLSINLFKL